MKTVFKSLLIGASFIAAVEATAQEATETCQAYYEFAENVMTSRQNGVAMPEVINIIPSDAGILISIVRDAYDRPRMSVEENQRRYITDFSNDIYGWCLDMFDQ